jgi:hypothetical protein
VLSIFNCENEQNAKRRFKLLYNDIKNLPPVVADFIRRLNVIMVLHYLMNRKRFIGLIKVLIKSQHLIELDDIVG